jgi:hypothetical protein
MTHDDLRRLVGCLRELGVRRYEHSGVVLELGDAPVATAAESMAEPATDDQARNARALAERYAHTHATPPDLAAIRERR